MNFNDKFLNVCFKMGKVLFSILLVISLGICLFMFFKTLGNTIKVKNIKMKYNYSAIEAVQEEIEKEYGAQAVAPQNIKKIEYKETPLERKIKDFAKEQNLSQSLTNELLQKINLIDEQDRTAYFENFVKFYNVYIDEIFEGFMKMEKFPEDVREEAKKDYKVYIKENSNNVIGEVYNCYLKYYNTEKYNINTERQMYISERNVSFISFLISLGVFILFLFLPILLRIEENTRKY